MDLELCPEIEMPDETNYAKEAEDDAKIMVVEFVDQIVEKLIDDGEASDDLNNDYSGGDSYHHETHVDKSYTLLEAANLLDQLSEHEETDSGLWEGQEPREAVSTQAAFTYGAAVYSEWADFVKTINEDAREVLDEFAGRKDTLEDELVALDAEEGGDDWTAAKEKRLKSVRKELDVLARKLKRALIETVYKVIEKDPPSPHGTGPREWSPK